MYIDSIKSEILVLLNPSSVCEPFMQFYNADSTFIKKYEIS